MEAVSDGASLKRSGTKPPSPNPLGHGGPSASAVADFVFNVVTEFGETLRGSVGYKQRVVPETGSAAGCAQQPSGADTFEHMFFAIGTDREQHTTKLRLPASLRHIAHDRNELREVCDAVALRPRIIR